MFLLDTNACIQFLNGTSPPLGQRMRGEDPAGFRISSVTKGELLYGARRSRRVAENLRLLEGFFATVMSLPFDDPCAEHYGAIRADLAARGQPVGRNDLMIAAIARAHDLTVVTHNAGEFSRIPGLRVEDWEG
jgi:tRNA(fMet)-specific endonuclease VapC